MPDRNEIYQQRAEECLRCARRSTSPKEKSEWEALASEWLKMAKDYEQIRAPDPAR